MVVLIPLVTEDAENAAREWWPPLLLALETSTVAEEAHTCLCHSMDWTEWPFPVQNHEVKGCLKWAK